MSDMTIGEFIDGLREDIERLSHILAAHPDTVRRRLPDGSMGFVSRTIVPDRVDILTTPQGGVLLVPYTLIGEPGRESRVYSMAFSYPDVRVVLRALGPEGRAILVNEVFKACVP